MAINTQKRANGHGKRVKPVPGTYHPRGKKKTETKKIVNTRGRKSSGDGLRACAERKKKKKKRASSEKRETRKKAERGVTYPHLGTVRKWQIESPRKGKPLSFAT